MFRDWIEVISAVVPSCYTAPTLAEIGTIGTSYPNLVLEKIFRNCNILLLTVSSLVYSGI